MLAREKELWEIGFNHIAGVDEAGRGPLAGPVVAAAVIFPENVFIPFVNDSKKLSPKSRAELFSFISQQALSIGVGIVEHSEIDSSNILQATMLAMQKAIQNLTIRPDYLLVDGNKFSHPTIPYETVVHGDAQYFSIAAASIVAKVTRDDLMKHYHLQYPHYGFERHKGYGTKQHIEAIEKFGFCAIHRRSFKVKGWSFKG